MQSEILRRASPGLAAEFQAVAAGTTLGNIRAGGLRRVGPGFRPAKSARLRRPRPHTGPVNAHSLDQLVPILQLAVGPVILISGVGLLLLTLTNRFGRMVDRSRVLVRELAAAPDGAWAQNLREQVAILSRRAAILRLSITLGAITVLLVGVLILVLFLGALLEWKVAPLVALLFSVAVISLIGSMVTFIRDMNLALAAARLDLQLAPPPRSG